MSRYDGLIIPRSYSEYINKTDAATLQQALQLSGVLSGAVAAGDNKAVTSDAVYGALTDAATIQQALQVPGVLSETVAAGDNKAVTSDAVYGALTDAATIQQALQVPGVLSETVAAGDNKAVTSNAVNDALAKYTVCSTGITLDANIAFSLAPTNSGKTTYYLCNENTPNIGYWWNIEAVCNNIYGNDFIFQRAIAAGAPYEIYVRGKNGKDSTWTEWKKIPIN